MVKDLNGVTLDEGVWIQMYPCGEDKKRNGSGSMFSLGSGNATGGYIPLSVTRRFADSETNSSGALVKTFWIEVRVLLLQNGDVVVSRTSLARNSTAIHWNANALGDTASRQQALESYTQQRAGSIEAGIRQGLKSVGFRMDGETWSVNTWGNLFAWYANEKDAKAGNTGNAVMYMAQDSGTWTLHVKGYVEATGGTFNGTVKADLLYGKTLDVTETTNYDIDPNTSPAACFMYRDPSIGIHYITLPKASDYDGLEIQVYFLCTKPLTREGFPYVYIKPKNGETLYTKESVKAGTKDSNGHIPYFIDLNTGYTAYNGQWCFLARNNLYKFKSIGGNWYAIEGYFGSLY